MKLLRAFSFLIAMLAIPLAAQAVGRPFDQAQFERLIAAGQPVAVIVHAGWCVTCRAQEPLLQALTAEPEFRRLTLLRVDFDRQKDVVYRFRATLQSTLIVFREGKEVGRSVAETNKERLAELLRKAL